MSDDAAEWVLETIKTEWPDGEANFPDNLERINRDDSRNLDTGERSRSAELEQGIFIGASQADETREPMGLSYNYRVETTVSIRIEGLHEDQFGQVASAAAFKDLVDNIKESINRVRKDPPIDGGSIDYHTITPENETSQSSDHRDYFRKNFDVTLHGWEFRDD